jgi:hypothetical protein
MTTRDPLLRTASRISRELNGAVRACDTPDAQLGRDLAAVLDLAAQVRRIKELLLLVHGRNWPAATRCINNGALHLLAELREITASTLARSRVAPSPAVSLDGVVAELRQLAEEFEDVRFDLRNGRVVAVTPPIELEGIALGPFAIELHVQRLSHRPPDASCFTCNALQPNPASSNSSVTHPHVQDGQLCAGDATAPIASALRQGRICDAFCLVRSVLQTYNAGSPYVALDEWEGTPCADCGRSSSPDQSSCCEHCEQDYCDGCMSYCDGCDGSCCRGCLERDEEAHVELCPSCRTTCTDCDRIVRRGDVDPSGRCSTCRADAEAEQADEDEDESQTQVVQPEDHDDTPNSNANDDPTPAAPAGVAERDGVLDPPVAPAASVAPR